MSSKWQRMKQKVRLTLPNLSGSEQTRSKHKSSLRRMLRRRIFARTSLPIELLSSVQCSRMDLAAFRALLETLDVKAPTSTSVGDLFRDLDPGNGFLNWSTVKNQLRGDVIVASIEASPAFNGHRVFKDDKDSSRITNAERIKQGELQKSFIRLNSFTPAIKSMQIVREYLRLSNKNVSRQSKVSQNEKLFLQKNVDGESTTINKKNVLPKTNISTYIVIRAAIIAGDFALEAAEEAMQFPVHRLLGGDRCGRFAGVHGVSAPDPLKAKGFQLLSKTCCSACQAAKQAVDVLSIVPARNDISMAHTLLKKHKQQWVIGHEVIPSTSLLEKELAAAESILNLAEDMIFKKIERRLLEVTFTKGFRSIDDILRLPPNSGLWGDEIRDAVRYAAQIGRKALVLSRKSLFSIRRHCINFHQRACEYAALRVRLSKLYLNPAKKIINDADALFCGRVAWHDTSRSKYNDDTLDIECVLGRVIECRGNDGEKNQMMELLQDRRTLKKLWNKLVEASDNAHSSSFNDIKRFIFNVPGFEEYTNNESSIDILKSAFEFTVEENRLQKFTFPRLLQNAFYFKKLWSAFFSDKENENNSVLNMSISWEIFRSKWKRLNSKRSKLQKCNPENRRKCNVKSETTSKSKEGCTEGESSQDYLNLKKQFDEIDSDSSGYIDFKEFCAYMVNHAIGVFGSPVSIHDAIDNSKDIEAITRIQALHRGFIARQNDSKPVTVKVFASHCARFALREAYTSICDIENFSKNTINGIDNLQSKCIQVNSELKYKYIDFGNLEITENAKNELKTKMKECFYLARITHHSIKCLVGLPLHLDLIKSAVSKAPQKLLSIENVDSKLKFFQLQYQYANVEAETTLASEWKNLSMPSKILVPVDIFSKTERKRAILEEGTASIAYTAAVDAYRCITEESTKIDTRIKIVNISIAKMKEAYLQPARTHLEIAKRLLIQWSPQGWISLGWEPTLSMKSKKMIQSVDKMEGKKKNRRETLDESRLPQCIHVAMNRAKINVISSYKMLSTVLKCIESDQEMTKSLKQMAVTCEHSLVSALQILHIAGLPQSYSSLKKIEKLLTIDENSFEDANNLASSRVCNSLAANLSNNESFQIELLLSRERHRHANDALTLNHSNNVISDVFIENLATKCEKARNTIMKVKSQIIKIKMKLALRLEQEKIKRQSIIDTLLQPIQIKFNMVENSILLNAALAQQPGLNEILKTTRENIRTCVAYLQLPFNATSAETMKASQNNAEKQCKDIAAQVVKAEIAVAKCQALVNERMKRAEKKLKIPRDHLKEAKLHHKRALEKLLLVSLKNASPECEMMTNQNALLRGPRDTLIKSSQPIIYQAMQKSRGSIDIAQIILERPANCTSESTLKESIDSSNHSSKLALRNSKLFIQMVNK